MSEQRSGTAPFVTVAVLAGVWIGGMAYLTADARRRGVRLSGLGAPRGYIRKPKPKRVVDEEAFWKEAQASTDRIVAMEIAVNRARVPKYVDPKAKKAAEWERTKREFYASLQPKAAEPRLTGEEKRLKDLDRRIAEAKARGDLIEAKRLSSEARFIITARLQREDDEEYERRYDEGYRPRRV